MLVRVTSGYFYARLTSARLPIQPEFSFSIEVDLDDIQLKGKTVPVKNQHSLSVILFDYLELAQALGLHSA